MALSKAYREQVRELMVPLGPVTFKPMFGGEGVYLDGLMFGMAFGHTLYLKADAETAPLFESAGSERFTYHTKVMAMKVSYWVLPDDGQDDPEIASRWARLAVDAALRAQSPTTRKGRAKRDDIGPGPWDG